MTDAAEARAVRRTLLIGGILLMVGAVATFALASQYGSAIVALLAWAGMLAYSAAVLVYAWGWGRGGSIVGRRPLAVVAASLIAVWPVAERILTLIYPVDAASGEFYAAWTYVSLAVELGATIVFVVQIARAGVLRGSVRWAPLWGLVAVVAPQLLLQIALVAGGIPVVRSESDGILVLLAAGQLVALAVPLTLGVLSLVVANRRLEHTETEVQIYPPPAGINQ